MLVGQLDCSTSSDCFPIDPGEVDNWKTALADLIGPRYQKYVDQRGRFGLDQQTPVGPGLVVYWEAEGPAVSFEQLVASDDPFDSWLQSEFDEANLVGRYR